MFTQQDLGVSVYNYVTSPRRDEEKMIEDELERIENSDDELVYSEDDEYEEHKGYNTDDEYDPKKIKYYSDKQEEKQYYELLAFVRKQHLLDLEKKSQK